MISVIREFVNDPSTSFLMKAIDCIVALRAVAVQEDEVQRFNDFLRSIKEDVSPKIQVFFKDFIVNKGITLIKQSENLNGVDDAEAEKV